MLSAVFFRSEILLSEYFAKGLCSMISRASMNFNNLLISAMEEL